jgi:PAS domain S-box-containing protein
VEEMKILIVDDIELNLELLEAWLEGNGYEVISAMNGVEALEILKTDSVDMIISDILMPKMDGYRLCRECKQSDALRKIPFIFYTATYTDKQDEEFALSLGADRFIVKPAESKLFMEIIESILREYKNGYLAPSETLLEKEETVYLKEYNERLIRKLEKKILDLEKEAAERKQAEAVLRDREEKYQDLYDNAPDMFISVDSETATIISCNQTLADALDYKKEEIIGRPIFDVYAPDSAKRVKEVVFQLFLKTGSIQGEELQLQRKDRSKIDVSLNTSAVRDEKGNILYSRSVWRDITKQKKLENQLQQAQKMEAIGTLAGTYYWLYGTVIGRCLKRHIPI